MASNSKVGAIDSHSDPSYGCCYDLPSQASLWRKEHLESLGIFYSDRCIPVTEIIGCLKSLLSVRESRSDGPTRPQIPEIMLKIIDFIKNIWYYSVDADDIKLSSRHILEQMNKMKKEFSRNSEEFRQQNVDLLRDDDNNSIFSDWCSRMKMFLNWWDVFLKRLRDQETRGGLFTQLYMQFSLICLLQPEIGESYKEQMRVKGILVSAIPDVRFPKFTDYSTTELHSTVEVVTLAEIKDISYAKKRCHGLTSEAFNVHNILPNELLGQHGAELLVETKRSCFRPKVTGMICVASKVIFTYLDMDSEHLKIIKGKEKEKGSCKSIIKYSRPYDFMDAYDRSEVLEAFFWLGYFQSAEFVQMI